MQESTDKDSLTAERQVVDSPTDMQARQPSSQERPSGPPPLPLRAALLCIAVFLGGAGIVALYVPDFPRSDLDGFILLTVMTIVADRMGIIAYSDSKISISYICLFAIAILYGPPGIVIAAPITALVLHLPRNVFSYRFLFNIGNITLANGLAAVVLWGLIDHETLEISPELIVATLAAAAMTYFVNSFMVTGIASMATRQSVMTIWREKFQWVFPHYVVFGLLGLAMALSYYALGVTGLAVFAAPPLMMRLAIKQYIDKTARNVAILKRKNEQLERANQEIVAMTGRLKETYNATLEALAAALDARDSETGGHSSRVTVYTMDMAREMGVDDKSPEWVNIERAALLHDVGKIGISDAILNKAGPLTPEEWQEMRRHPAIGHELLRDVKFLSDSAQIIYTHHERYDGKGYPTGLQGEEVPLGARIFAVADAFDAMTSDRPYRRALPAQKAREEILSNAGSQFDPRVVEAFLNCLSAWEERLETRRETKVA